MKREEERRRRRRKKERRDQGGERPFSPPSLPHSTALHCTALPGQTNANQPTDLPPSLLPPLLHFAQWTGGAEHTHTHKQHAKKGLHSFLRLFTPNGSHPPPSAHGPRLQRQPSSGPPTGFIAIHLNNNTLITHTHSLSISRYLPPFPPSLSTTSTTSTTTTTTTTTTPPQPGSSPIPCMPSKESIHLCRLPPKPYSLPLCLSLSRALSLPHPHTPPPSRWEGPSSGPSAGPVGVHASHSVQHCSTHSLSPPSPLSSFLPIWSSALSGKGYPSEKKKKPTPTTPMLCGRPFPFPPIKQMDKWTNRPEIGNHYILSSTQRGEE